MQPLLSNSRGRYALAFLAALIVIAVQIQVRGEHNPILDEVSYLTVVDDLNRSGTFTDGSFAKPELASAPGRFLGPGYPMFLHLISRADPALAEAVNCHRDQPEPRQEACGGSFASAVAVQAILAAIQATAVFAIAYMISGTLALAWLALALSLMAGSFAEYARMMLSENTAFLGFYLFLAGAVAWARRESATTAALAGAALSFAALSRPSYIYLVYACAGAIAFLALLSTQNVRAARLRSTMCFVAAGALVLAPWMIRNFVQFGDTALTHGYAGLTLAQRVAYNAMTGKEWLVAWVYWLPDFGDNLIRAVLPERDWIRLGWTDPSSFYQTGTSTVFVETLAAAGGSDRHLGYLLRHCVFGDLAKHVAVTLPLTMRGIWAGGYLALAGVLLAAPVVRRLAGEGRLGPLAALVLPLSFMAVLHGFVSVNIVRYNEPMIAFYALVVAGVIVDLWRRYASVAGIARSGGDGAKT